MAHYDVTAIDAKGVVHGHRTDTVPPDLARMGAFGDEHRAGYVEVHHEDGRMVFARDGGGRWHLLCDGADRRAAHEMVLWFELLHHYPGPGRDDPDHPLAGEPAPGARGELERTEALRLLAERIAASGSGYPVEALVAERFPGGWYVYAPVEVDDSDPMAFLESLPVGRSVFLVGDLGRVREATASLPPDVLRERFRAEEAFIRRKPEEESFMNDFADLWEQATRSPGAQAEPVAASFTVVNEPSETSIIKQADGLLGPIVQQLSLLGPEGWESFTAVFSCTVGAEIAQLSFRSGRREIAVRVPEKLAVLVRRQRHLAARMSDGPWYRLLVEADAHLDFAGLSIDYDYGDEPLPADQLLPAVHYREDLFAYPRPTVPDWLTRYLEADGPGRATVPKPNPKPAPERAPVPAAAPLAPTPAAPRVVLDVKHEWRRLYADGERIAYGKESIALDDIEWVCYPVTRAVTHRLFGLNSYTTTYGIGVGPGGHGLGNLQFVVLRKNAGPPQEWTTLVELVQRHVEPRLLEGYFARVAAGETVALGALQLDRNGVGAHTQGDRRGPRKEIAWGALAPVRVENGAVWLHRVGEQKETIQVPLGHANAVLLPTLLPALARLFTGGPRR